MLKIVPIVEGDGEESTVPVLLRKILFELMRYDIQIAHPKNAHGRANLQRAGGVERFIRHAWKELDCAVILILLDAEGECPLDIAKDFSTRIEAMGVMFPVVIVVANRMYETWLLASIATIAGHANLPAGLQPPPNVETVKNPKAWIDKRLPRGRSYKETQDQEAMTHHLDTTLARQARSFQRLLHAISEALESIESVRPKVTPSFEVR